MEIELLADFACVCGEGPLYHPQENTVYWTDIDTGRLFKVHCATGEYHKIYEGAPVGGMTLQADGSLLLFMDRGAVRVFENGQITGTVSEEIPDELETRFNDVIADPAGRVFCGTMPTNHRPGRLYRLETDGTLYIVQEGIGCSNGMGFTADRKTMYYTDTSAGEIYRFDYNEMTGAITNRSVLIKTTGPGAADGMTVDADGNLWSARWGGKGIVGYAPDGTQIAFLELPVNIVSSVIFGGPNYDEMYVTTAGGNRKPEEGQLSGGLFRLRHVELNGKPVRGVPEYVSRIGL